MSWTVYRHITPSGKSYIGITSQKPERRWKNGKGYSKNTPFGKAIETYKWENIKHEILNTNLTEDEAKRLEMVYIEKYRTFVGFSDRNGYNCTLGGEGTVGFSHIAWNKGIPRDDETKRKISESHKGKTVWNKGIPRTEEEKMNISASLKGKPGKPMSEDAKRKNSESHKGKHPSKESIRKNSEAHKGRTPWNKGKTGVQVAWNKGKTGVQFSNNKGKHRVYHEDGTFHFER